MNAFNYLVINTTCRCNTICKYCFQAADCFKDGEDFLTFEIFKDIIDFCLPRADQDRRIIHFTGGEPMLNKDFFRMLQYGIEKKYIIRIQTNGLLLKDCSKEEMKLISNPLVTMKISLDGATPDQHEYLREPGTFDQVVSGIKKATAVNPMVGIKTCIHKKNIDHLRELLDFSRENKVAGFSYNIIRQEGYAQRLDPACYEGISELEVVRRLVPIYNLPEYQYLLNGNQISMYYFAKHTGIACGSQFYIDYDGRMYSYQQCLPDQYIGDLKLDNWEKQFDAERARELEYIIPVTKEVIEYVKANLHLRMKKNS